MQTVTACVSYKNVVEYTKSMRKGEPMGWIYKITNTINGMSYIGKTTRDPEKTRIKEHISGSDNTLLSNDIETYGKDAFDFEILHAGVAPELLDTHEIESIKTHATIAPDGPRRLQSSVWRSRRYPPSGSPNAFAHK